MYRSRKSIGVVVLVVVLNCIMMTVPSQAMIDKYGDTIEKDILAEKEESRERKDAITRQYKALQSIESPTSIYSEKPRLEVPYNPGVLKPEVLNEALETLRYIRFLAGLETPVRLNDKWNEAAQAGAFVNALNGNLTHSPVKPAGVSDAMYQLGYSATSTGNIAWGYRTLSGTLWGYMNDGDAYNIDRLGHRRWLLNPAMTTVGFGMIEDGYYSVNKVFDDGVNTIWHDDTDFNYITWPSEGAFPKQAFGMNHPWSISLNEKRFNNIDTEDIEVVMTNLNTGDVESFSWDADRMESGAYFNIETNGYGIPFCVIFRPSEGTNIEGGRYQVDISGVKYINGGEASIRYQVEFFDPATWTMTNMIDGSNEVYAVALKEAGLFRGSDKGFELNRAPTRIEGLVMFLRLLGLEEEALNSSGREAPFRDVPTWGKPYVDYAYRSGFVKGIGNNQFGSLQAMTAKDYQTLILRASDYEEGVDFRWETSLEEALEEAFITPNMYAWMQEHPFLRSDLVAASYYAYKRQ